MIPRTLPWFTPVVAGTVAFATALAGPAAAVSVSGQVTDEFAVGIFDVDLDFTDTNTGNVIFTPNDNTDFSGFYSVDVPVGTYDILFRPPLGSPYIEAELRDVDITGITTLDHILFIGRPVFGTITDAGSAPLFNIDLNFRDTTTGDVIDTNDDNSDSLGVFRVVVPAGTYDVLFTAPAGQPYAGLEIPSVVVVDSLDLGAHVLPAGWFVSGTVRDPGALPVTDTDLDFEDTVSGETIYTPRDNTDGTGVFNVAVPTGTYDVTVKSPATSSLAWVLVPDVAVSANTALGTVTLPPGHAITGTLQDPALMPLVGADLDLIDVQGREVPMPNDNTTTGGAFSLLGAAGTYDVAAFPPPGVPLAAAIQRGVVVNGPVNLGALTLVAGYEVSGTVTSGGSPVADADLDAYDLSAGSQLHPTANDNSDALGNYSIRLPGGSYLLVANPPAGSGLSPDSVVVLALNADRTEHFQLGGGVDAVVSVPTRPGLVLQAPRPNPLHDATRLVFDLPAGTRDARIDIYDVSGRAVRRLPEVGGAGRHVLFWDGRNDSGRRVAAGVYHVRLRAGDAAATRKVVVRR
ncbi:MAG: T9SS type A sorting domain-containing protein [Gemmatimonadetes bacterium]|nr:T9SS type A sorting domain-containing protein [Gemmatimonadota bacterium]